ncbi:MAG: ABC transporter permease [Actinomycetota bacterium]|nr:ABC transporter permease [Actinomycetota bacterium]
MSAVPTEAARPAQPVVVVAPSTGWAALRLGDLWSHRDLLYFLAWRDVKVRYTQAALGAAWAVVQPLLMMAVFSIFLGRLAKVPSDGVPYPVFVFCGLVAWTYFANAVSTATESLVSSANLISKVYFPRLVMPLAALVSWLPDLAIASVILVGLMLLYGLTPAWTVVLLPLFAGAAVLAAASVSVWLSALNVAYRDVRYAVPFLIQLGLFATPVIYPASIVPDNLRLLYGLNPMAGVVEGFRWALLGHGDAPIDLIAVSAATSTLLLVGGLFYFRRVEQGFADVI